MKPNNYRGNVFPSSFSGKLDMMVDRKESYCSSPGIRLLAREQAVWQYTLFITLRYGTRKCGVIKRVAF